MATQSVKSMVSETSICNQALSWLGAKAIVSLEDPSTEAEYCRNNYPFIRDAVLEERAWSFALARQSSTVADLSEWGNLYEHSVPLDWMQVLRVYKDSAGEQVAEWSKEGPYVLADSATIYMWGVKRVTNTSLMSNMFVQCLAARMAAELAIPLTGKKQLQADMWVLYQQKLNDAAARDGAQGRNELMREGKLTSVRYSNGNTARWIT